MMMPVSIQGNRAPVDHLEVRSLQGGRLLGWITGIAADKVPAGKPLVFQVPDDSMVIEDEDGVEEIGLVTQISTQAFNLAFTSFRDHAALANIHAEVPSYAQRVLDITNDVVRYRWTAAVADVVEHQDLFDFDNFVPYGEDLPVQVLQDESTFHGKPVALAPHSYTSGKSQAAALAFARSRAGALPFYSDSIGVMTTCYGQAAQSLSKTAQGFGTAASQVGEQLKKALAQQTAMSGRRSVR